MQPMSVALAQPISPARGPPPAQQHLVAPPASAAPRQPAAQMLPTFGELPPPDPLLFEITRRLAEIDVSHMDAFLAVPLTTQSELVNVVKAMLDEAVDAFNLASMIDDI